MQYEKSVLPLTGTTVQKKDSAGRRGTMQSARQDYGKTRPNSDSGLTANVFMPVHRRASLRPSPSV